MCQKEPSFLDYSVIATRMLPMLAEVVFISCPVGVNGSRWRRWHPEGGERWLWSITPCWRLTFVFGLLTCLNTVWAPPMIWDKCFDLNPIFPTTCPFSISFPFYFKKNSACNLVSFIIMVLIWDLSFFKECARFTIVLKFSVSLFPCCRLPIYIPSAGSWLPSSMRPPAGGSPLLTQ